MLPLRTRATQRFAAVPELLFVVEVGPPVLVRRVQHQPVNFFSPVTGGVCGTQRDCNSAPAGRAG